MARLFAVLLAWFVAAGAYGQADVLTKGVTSIAAPGSPGPVVVYGEHAFAVVAGREDKNASLPVVAGATWGIGHVVAFGHTGYLDASNLSEGAGTLVENSLRWAGGDKPKVATVRNKELCDWMHTRGFDCVNLDDGWPARLPAFSVVCVGAHALKDDESQALAGWVQKGGGLLVSGLGWGWLQLNPGKTIREHPGNRLLVDAGLAFGDGTLDRTSKDGYTVAEIDAAVHARRALAMIEDAAKGKAAAGKQASTSLTAAVRVAPEKHDLMGRCRTLLRDYKGDLAPTQSKPIKADQGLERALIALQVELERQSVPERVAAHPAAAAFPGKVDDAAPRVARTIEIDTSEAGWHGTGLYAAAGETILVRLSPEAAKVGLSLRVGCHTDHLWHLDQWRRVPDISRSTALDRPVTRFASAFGGLVYIEGGRRRQNAGTIRVEIEGVVESPRFVLGRTTPEEWKKSRGAPGAWGELETEKIIVSVPSAALRGLDDPESLMKFWDQISDAHATLETIPLERARPERYVADIQISAGYMHSGYPIMTHLDAVDEMISLEKLQRGTWGLLHELGHNHQQGDWTFDGTGEVTCNLFALHAIDTICTPKEGDRGHDGVNAPPSMDKYLAGGAKFDAWKKDPFLALHMYVQLQKAFGWETFKTVFAEYRALPRDQRPKNDDEKRDQWMVRFSRVCGKNLGPFFEAWGVPTSQVARDSITNLPGWMPEDWPVIAK